MSDSPIRSQDPAFVFERHLRASLDNELLYAAQDLGPTDRLPPDLLELERQLFFGPSPLTSPCTSPSPSRSASPNRVNLPTDSISTSPSASSSNVTNPPRRVQSSKAAKNKKKSHDHRRRERRARRDSCRSDPYEVRGRVAVKYVQTAHPTQTSFDASQFPTASTGFIALPDEGGRDYTLRELVEGKGFKVEAWDGRHPRPITDASTRIIAILAGKPDDPDWESLQRGAAEAIRAARGKCRFPKKAVKHRRGNFPALSWGISHGGGQTQPGNLHHTVRNSSVLSDLTANENISRIAGFANGAFAAWAPKLYSYYEASFEKLLKHDKALKRNWPNSIWASYAINFGPKTTCRRHRDFANLPFGWCAITALGDFDPTSGGHLVLWDMKLIIQFPPGATILIPSAAISHSNIPINRGEERYSLAQYSAGGLFRWVEQGFQPTPKYVAKLDAAGIQEDLRKQDERCKLGLSLFSTLRSIGADQTARNQLI